MPRMKAVGVYDVAACKSSRIELNVEGEVLRSVALQRLATLLDIGTRCSGQFVGGGRTDRPLNRGEAK